MDKKINKSDELRKIIIENPNLPIKFFIAEDCNCGNFQYEESSVVDIVVDKLTLYEDRYYNEGDFREKLYDDILDEFDTEEELDKHIDAIIKSRNLKKTISVFIG